MSYRVTCPDGQVRHDGDFVRYEDALDFTRYGHACLSETEHLISDLDDPADLARLSRRARQSQLAQRTLDEARATCQKLAAEGGVDGQVTNGDCVYATAGQPVCIVGHVLVEWGVPAEELEGGENAGAVASLLCKSLGLPEAVADYLDLVQQEADTNGGLTRWSVALERAEDVLSRR